MQPERMRELKATYVLRRRKPDYKTQACQGQPTHGNHASRQASSALLAASSVLSRSTKLLFATSHWPCVAFDVTLRPEGHALTWVVPAHSEAPDLAS